MMKKFRSRTAALRFAKTTGMKVVQGKAAKLADGTKAHWFKLTKGKKTSSYRITRKNTVKKAHKRKR